MEQDPFPTFRRAATAVYRAARTLPSRKRLGMYGMGVAILCGLGYLSAVVSRGACERELARELAEMFDIVRLEPTWIDRNDLHSIPFPPDKLAMAHDRDSLFAPTRAYRPNQWNDFTAADGSAAWAYVKGVAPLPFVVRAYYGYSFSRPRERSPGVWSRSGADAEGVLTCACAFGVVVPVHNWATGGMFD